MPKKVEGKEKLARYFGVEGTTEPADTVVGKDEILPSGQDDKIEPTVPAKRMGTVVVNAVRVRMGPAVATTTIGVVYKGEQVEVLKVMEGYKQTWGQIEFEGRKAWVALEYFGQRLIEVSGG